MIATHLLSRLRACAGLALALAASAAALTQPAHAKDEWPSRPVKLIVPSAAGGGTDVYARLLATSLSKSMRQSFVVENRPGASGNVGTQSAARATPDGYTFLITANAAVAISPALYSKLPFDVERDLVPIARGVMAPMVLVATPNAGIASFADLIRLGKQKPGELPYGSAGEGSPPYLGVRMVEETSGARFLHVPYKGVSPAYQDLLSGRLKFMFTDLSSVQPFIQSGKLVALAVNDKTRLLPNVPSLAEAGLKGVQVWTSFSLFAPTGVPPAVVRKLSEEVAQAMKTAELASALEAHALVPVFDTPDAFRGSLTKEREQWASFIRRNGIHLE
ncbi:tripartite tricarboxylate transporter substrate binding protein [Cupriavidus sp. CV2]|uniref:Bug family tripartite tricarboxylate transporter substrate binding protein n=1 Tax=Cupriavidus ulmosensis TaxID=3065913 RepID=UPI00296AEAD7|nr:tripartite tricarboxylate transporter substrate binding protein [Cupriavidus sp. CV2]MDW3686620.1 tripartite tricarboxylate transporter substrate binding protein [Cupriavidus sp. CV2]